MFIVVCATLAVKIKIHKFSDATISIVNYQCIVLFFHWNEHSILICRFYGCYWICDRWMVKCTVHTGHCANELLSLSSISKLIFDFIKNSHKTFCNPSHIYETIYVLRITRLFVVFNLAAIVYLNTDIQLWYFNTIQMNLAPPFCS